MSRWLQIATDDRTEIISLPDTLTKGDKSPTYDTAPPFCRVLSGCRVEPLDKNQGHNTAEIGQRFCRLIDRFQEKAAILEYDEGLPRDRATWLAALAVFVRSDERKAWFGAEDNLLAHVDQVSIAAEGVTVTFHKTGRVVFADDNETPNEAS